VASVVSTVSVASVDLPVDDVMKVLEVFVDRRLTFEASTRTTQLWRDRAITIYRPSATYVTC